MDPFLLAFLLGAGALAVSKKSAPKATTNSQPVPNTIALRVAVPAPVGQSSPDILGVDLDNQIAGFGASGMWVGAVASTAQETTPSTGYTIGTPPLSTYVCADKDKSSATITGPTDFAGWSPSPSGTYGDIKKFAAIYGDILSYAENTYPQGPSQLTPSEIATQVQAYTKAKGTYWGQYLTWRVQLRQAYQAESNAIQADVEGALASLAGAVVSVVTLGTAAAGAAALIAVAVTAAVTATKLAGTAGGVNGVLANKPTNPYSATMDPAVLWGYFESGAATAQLAFACKTMQGQDQKYPIFLAAGAEFDVTSYSSLYGYAAEYLGFLW